MTSRKLNSMPMAFFLSMTCHYAFANDIYKDFITFKDFITTEQMIPYFTESFENNTYLSENGYSIIPESATLTYPESTVTITVSIGSAILYGVPQFAIVSFFGVLFANIFFADDIHNFYENRLKFHISLLDKDHIPVKLSCLAFFGYIPDTHTLVVETDTCDLLTITGLDNPPIMKMPQTVDGVVRLDDTIPLVGRWDDWLQGQTKVVDVFAIPLPE